MNKNPIVGLAYVVTSQQEMLEKANGQIEELKQELENLDRVKSQKLEDLWKDFSEVSERKAQLEEERNDLKKNVDAVIEQHKQLKEKYFELQQSYDRYDLFRWIKWIPGMKIKTDICGLFPLVDGLYYYDESNTQKLYGNTETIDLKDCYGVNIVRMTNLNGYSECEIAPIDVEGATLVAVCVRYVRPYTAIRECPTIYDTPSHTFEDMFLEGMSPEDMTDLI